MESLSKDNGKLNSKEIKEIAKKTNDTELLANVKKRSTNRETKK